MSNKDNPAGDKPGAPRPAPRAQAYTGLRPAYAPGEFVYLKSPMPGFPDGTRFKVIGAQVVANAQHRYELQALGQSVWVLEPDLRATPPESIAKAPGYNLPDRGMSMTQRMQTMTLSQRMEMLGISTPADTESTATQRLKTIDFSKPPTLPPDISGPVTGAPLFDDRNPVSKPGPNTKPGGGKR